MIRYRKKINNLIITSLSGGGYGIFTPDGRIIEQCDDYPAAKERAKEIKDFIINK